MRRVSPLGLILAGVGFLGLGFFWGGPGFIRLGNMVETYGPFLCLFLLFTGIGLVVYDDWRYRKRWQESNRE